MVRSWSKNMILCIYYLECLMQLTLGFCLVRSSDVNPQVDNLYSIVGQHKREKNATQKEIDKGLDEQAAILQMDDIVDYDSDADGGGRQPVSNGTNDYASNQTVATASQASGSRPVCDESSSDRKPKGRQPPAVPIPSFDASPSSDAEIIVID
jgi:hypothetical protein